MHRFPFFMLRKTKKLLLASRERLVSLVLLPAFCLGSLPQTACICADGHREASCPMLRQQATEAGRACCQKSASVRKTCCGNCSAKSSQSPSECRIAAQAGSCCHPVVEAPAAATAAKRSDLIDQLPQPVASGVPSWFVVAAQTWPAILPAIDSTPPPRDVVIELSRLT